MHRKIKITFAALALSAGFAGQAQAATSTVRLHTAADTTRFLSDSASGVTSMNKVNASDPLQKWRKTDTTSGYATYTNVSTGRCLTGRGLQGFPVVTSETCKAGATNQQWRLGVSGDFQLRLNGLVASHNTAGNGTGVLMSLFTAKPNQKWHTHAA
ncbi:MAG TPA: RICIN domain-containing protein [Solirubrobacter sp.]